MSEVRDNKNVANVKIPTTTKEHALYNHSNYIAQMLLYIYTLPYIFMAIISASSSQSSPAVILVLVYGYTKQKQVVSKRLYAFDHIHILSAPNSCPVSI